MDMGECKCTKCEIDRFKNTPQKENIRILAQRFIKESNGCVDFDEGVYEFAKWVSNLQEER